MRYLKVAALVGWALVVLQWRTAVRLVREHQAELAVVGRVREAAHGCDQLPHSTAREWGGTLANAGAALIRDGFENQAPYLFAASGELLERADRQEVR